MTHNWLPASLIPVVVALAAPVKAETSAELYQNQAYTYGRFEARVRFAPGDGIISSFFLWKPGSEMDGIFWNELDFEKLGADCHLQTNPLYGAPVADHSEVVETTQDLCGAFHTYAFEWTPTYIAYLIDGVEVRRDIGEVATAFANNATEGMQIHFNVWPGDASFGGNFDPASLPVQQHINWVQYSSFDNDVFTLVWRENFVDEALPSGWSVGNWPSPKNLSTHAPANVGFVGDLAVLSLTADDAVGVFGEAPVDNETSIPSADGASDTSRVGAGLDDGQSADSNPTTGTTGDVGDNDSANSSTSDSPAPGMLDGEQVGGNSIPDMQQAAAMDLSNGMNSPRSDSGCALSALPQSSHPAGGLSLIGFGLLFLRRNRRSCKRVTLRSQ